MSKSLGILVLVALGLFGVGGSEARASCTQFLNMGGYWAIQNHCGRTMFVRWTDQGACRNGCAARVALRGRRAQLRGPMPKPT